MSESQELNSKRRLLPSDIRASIELTVARYQERLYEFLTSPLVFIGDENLRNALPAQGGVYRIIETGADWLRSLYIGKSNNLQNRVYRNHLMGNRKVSTFKHKLIESKQYADAKAVKHYLKEKCSVHFITIDDEVERTGFEHFAIAILQPKYND